MSQSENPLTVPQRELASSDPVFIVGCPRSGTTLLATIFDRHSQMAVTPETFYFRHFWKFVLGGRERCSAQQLVKLFTEGRYTRELQLDPKLLAEYVGSGEVSVMDFVRTAINLFAHLKGKSRCAEKTPVHLFFVPQIIKYYPQSRIICIYRDGRDSALSLRKVSHAVPALRGYAARWRESTIAMLKFQDQFPDRFKTIRYESLLAQPTEEITNLMQFVGLEFEPGQLDPSKSAGVFGNWDFQDKKNVLAEINPSRAYAWKRTASPQEIRLLNSMMRPYLGQLGYEPGDDNLGSWPVRTYDAILNSFYRFTFASRFAESRRMLRYVLWPFVGTSPHIEPLKPLHPAKASQ